MPSFLVTGSSRGLGLAFVTELLKFPENKVIATARNTKGAEGLQALASKHSADQLVLLDLDITSQESIDRAAAEAARILPDGLDHLIGNAGVNEQALVSFEDLDLSIFQDELNFNLISTIRLYRAFLPLIRKSTAKKIVQVTSVLGSIELAAGSPGLANGYSVAKAALNMLVRKWGPSLKAEGITTILIHPGWVGQTEIGDSIAPYIHKYSPGLPNIPQEESAAGVIKVVKEATIEDTGAFFNYDGMAHSGPLKVSTSRYAPAAALSASGLGQPYPPLEHDWSPAILENNTRIARSTVADRDCQTIWLVMGC
ncbi:putative short-chain dehydrogenases/reductase [Cercophora scortea]|uniref:Short-chain dehydrogenases/reductase n=1 Tax=Cercophora scortea TaxID=314031 RepID=A0AAE0M8W4_9PEZI|nr:putative short-chain dehydrogenases/reductase [Cercophora scortea]